MASVAAWRLHCSVSRCGDVMSHIDFLRELVHAHTRSSSRVRQGGPIAPTPSSVPFDGMHHYLEKTSQGRCVFCTSNTTKPENKCIADERQCNTGRKRRCTAVHTPYRNCLIFACIATGCTKNGGKTRQKLPKIRGFIFKKAISCSEKRRKQHENRLINTEDTPTSTNTFRRRAAPASVA